MATPEENMTNRRPSAASFMSCRSLTEDDRSLPDDQSMGSAHPPSINQIPPSPLVPQLQSSALVEWIFGFQWSATTKGGPSPPAQVLNNPYHKPIRADSNNAGLSVAAVPMLDWSEVANHLNLSEPLVYFSVTHMESLLFFIVTKSLSSTKTSCLSRQFLLLWLCGVHMRTTVASLQTNAIISKIWKSLTESPDQSLYLHEQLDQLHRMTVDVSVTVMCAPEAFEGSSWTRESTVLAMQCLLKTSATNHGFISEVIEEAQDVAAESQLVGVIPDVLLQVYESLEERKLDVIGHPVMNQIRNICHVPQLATALVDQSFFLPELHSKTTKNAFNLEKNSFFGRLFSPSPIDCRRRSADSDKVVPLHEKVLPIVNGSIGCSNPTAGMNQLMTEHCAAIDASVTIIKVLLKSGDPHIRNRVLKWFSVFVEENSFKASIVGRRNIQMSVTAQVFELLSTNVQGLASSSMCLNVFIILIRLCEPIKLSKIYDLDLLYPTMCAHELLDPPDSNLICATKNDPVFISDDQNLQLAVSVVQCNRANALSQAAHTTRASLDASAGVLVKFPTIAFWLALKAARVLFYSVLYELEAMLRFLQKNADKAADGSSDKLIMKLLAYESITNAPHFVKSYAHFVALSSAVFMHASFDFNEKGQQTSQPGVPISDLHVRVGPMSLIQIPKTCLPETAPSPQFCRLPLESIEDHLECLAKYSSILVSPVYKWPSHPNRAAVELFVKRLELNVLVCMFLFVMNDRGDYIKSPHLKLTLAVKPLFTFGDLVPFHLMFSTIPFAKPVLMSGLIISFVEAQKSGYHMRINFRLFLTELMKAFFQYPEFQLALTQCRSSDSQEFSRFFHMFVSNASWLEEEAVSMLAEIRSRQKAGALRENESVRAAGEGGASSNADVSRQMGDTRTYQDDDDNNAVNVVEGHRNVDEMPMEELEDLCQKLWLNTNTSMNVFKSLIDTCSAFIRESEVLLQQVVLSLNCCLYHLIGPKCMSLKVSNFEKYNFEPRILLSVLIETFIRLARNNSEGSRNPGATFSQLVVDEICRESRHFSVDLFVKAHKIARREGIVRVGELEVFNELIKVLKDADNRIREDDSVLLEMEIPDEYLDPLMSEIMRDPVMLPSSGIICDRKTIERHLMSDEFDPFNRAPLKLSDLIPQADLKTRIEDYITSIRTTKQ